MAQVQFFTTQIDSYFYTSLTCYSTLSIRTSYSTFYFIKLKHAFFLKILTLLVKVLKSEKF